MLLENRLRRQLDLIRVLLEGDRTLLELSREVGMAGTTIDRYLAVLEAEGFKVRRRKKAGQVVFWMTQEDLVKGLRKGGSRKRRAPVTAAEAIAAYETGLTLRQAAEKLGVCYVTVQARLREVGYTLRPRGRQPRKKT